MNETIEKLIASGKEGPWWDFKQTYHQNNDRGTGKCMISRILWAVMNKMNDGLNLT
ncbi:hypothetical protein [Kluyvera georgiana]|uniref:hypothetical protein n=1 Tax=Kluyvera georgiana TaxID=73098 RepID=UPI00321FECAC